MPSGAMLVISVAPFAISRKLYQALLRELKGVNIKDEKEDTTVLFRQLFCIGFSSPEIEQCLEDCFKHCLYGGLKIDKDSFEPVENREDYPYVCMEVAKDNALPFVKGLFAELNRASELVDSIQKSKSQTTNS